MWGLELPHLPGLPDSDITIKITLTYVWQIHRKSTPSCPQTLWFISSPATVKFLLCGDQLVLVMLSYLPVTPIANTDYHTTHGCLNLYDTHSHPHTYGSFHKTLTRNLSITAWTMRELALQGISIKNTKELAAAYGWTTLQSILDSFHHLTRFSRFNSLFRFSLMKTYYVSFNHLFHLKYVWPENIKCQTINAAHFNHTSWVINFAHILHTVNNCTFFTQYFAHSIIFVLNTVQLY